jgi:hypothetical protein
MNYNGGRMKKLVFSIAVLFTVCFSNYALASPAPPQLCFTTDGLNISINWTTVPGANGYTLYYAPYPYTGEESIDSIDTGNETEVNFTLWDGASYYITATSRDSTGESSYSNIEFFTISSTSNTINPTCYPKTIVIPDTGQTSCYDTYGNVVPCFSTGQDGDFNNNSMSFTDNGNGTVTDNVTGLTWQQRDDSIARNWTTAADYCTNLYLGGYSNWRLPELLELVGIVDYEMRAPAINGNYFYDTKSSPYWTSSIPGFNQNSSYAVYFLHGGCYNLRNTSEYFVRCVH